MIEKKKIKQYQTNAILKKESTTATKRKHTSTQKHFFLNQALFLRKEPILTFTSLKRGTEWYCRLWSMKYCATWLSRHISGREKRSARCAIFVSCCKNEEKKRMLKVSGVELSNLWDSGIRMCYCIKRG